MKQKYRSHLNSRHHISISPPFYPLIQLNAQLIIYQGHQKLSRSRARFSSVSECEDTIEALCSILRDFSKFKGISQPWKSCCQALVAAVGLLSMVGCLVFDRRAAAFQCVTCVLSLITLLESKVTFVPGIRLHRWVDKEARLF